MIPILTDNLSPKANASDVYTKQGTNNLLDAKANASAVYTKLDTNNLLNDKLSIVDLEKWN